MKPLHARLLSAIALLAAACSEHHGDTSLNHYGAEMSESLDDVADAARTHHKQVLEAAELSEVREVERAYPGAMTMGMGAMHGAQRSIARCAERQSNAVHSETWQSMHDADDAIAGSMAAAMGEIARHARAMERASDLESAQAEEQTHQEAMDEMLNEMRMHNGDMMDAMHAMEVSGGSMMCPMASHMHH